MLKTHGTRRSSESFGKRRQAKAKNLTQARPNAGDKQLKRTKRLRTRMDVEILPNLYRYQPKQGNLLG